jgi:hypothetical protein
MYLEGVQSELANPQIHLSVHPLAFVRGQYTVFFTNP